MQKPHGLCRVKFNIWVKLKRRKIDIDDFSGQFEISIQSNKDMSLAAADIPLSNDGAVKEGPDDDSKCGNS